MGFRKAGHWLDEMLNDNTIGYAQDAEIDIVLVLGDAHHRGHVGDADHRLYSRVFAGDQSN